MATHSRKRRGRPGVAAAPRRTAPVPRARPAVPPARSEPPVAPDPANGGWTLPIWLMFVATLWSVFVLWRALFRWNETAEGQLGDPVPWILVVLVVVSGVSSFAAFLLLRRGEKNAARLPLWIATLTGLQGALVSLCAALSLWELWRARLARRYPVNPSRRRWTLR